MEKNYIKCCDCLEGLKDLPNNSIDLTVTSPPYDDLRTYDGAIEAWNFDKFRETALELHRVTKPGGVVVWIVNDATVNGSETGTSFRQALHFKACGFRLHDTMIWEKPTFSATGSLAVRYAPVFEYMFIFSKGKPKTFNPIKDRENKYAGISIHGTVRQRDGTFKKQSGYGKKTIGPRGQRHNVWHQPGALGKDRTGHPAAFPERIAADHIISWSNPGDVVLDPFMGGGTTAVAAFNNGRDFIGFEINEEYCQLATRRVYETINSDTKGE